MVGTIESAVGGGGGAPAGLVVTAKGLSFDTKELDLPAGQPTTITFHNEDAGIPHNIAIYTDETLSTALFQGEQFPGVATQEYQVPALDPGTLLLPLRRPHDDERHRGRRPARRRIGRRRRRRHRRHRRVAFRLSVPPTPVSVDPMAPRHALVPAVVALVLMAAACSGTDGASGADDPLGAKAMNEPAPALAGDTVGGGTAALADLRGKVVVVNFWATWCTPCRAEQPELVRLSDDYRHKGVEFLGVLERDDTAKAKAWLKEFGVPYPSIVDEPGAWADDFAFFGLPDTYVIDRAGTIRWSVFGQTDAAQLRPLIDEVLAQPA